MSWDEIKARWQAHLGRLARRWDRISERELDAIAGDRDRLSQRIQAVYRISAQEANQQIYDWERHVSNSKRSTHEPVSEPGVSEDDAVSGRGGNPVPGQPAGGHGYMDDEEQREMNESAPRGIGSSQRPSGMDRRD